MLALLAGCGREEPVVRYRAPKEPLPKTTRTMRVDYKTPAGWVDRTRTLPEFIAGPGENAPRVKLSVLKGSAGGLEANVNRWRGQVGLPAVGNDEARGLARPFSLLGEKGYFAEMTGKDRAILVAFTIGREMSFFLKMTGTPEEVARQRAAFEALAGSMKVGAER